MDPKVAKENLVAAFDKAQLAYETWQAALEAKKAADAQEMATKIEYENAKANWSTVLKENSPGAAA